MTRFVDTNVFIRFLTKDDPAKFQHCLDSFEPADQGRAPLVTSEAIIAEIVYVLSSSIYRVSRAEVARTVQPLVESRGITIEQKQTILHALELFGQNNLDFEDCLLAAHVRRLQLPGCYRYEGDLDRVPGLNRTEP